ncbi:MAG: hypothetical protein SFY80_09910 [Verrucomicrobiota bacterium]|nr:hypothetical protein [Verrucomicrobiota bacterium]
MATVSGPRKAVHVIAHTHWDRSWYWPFERFRIKLVECVKAVVRELKAHPDYSFNFDGQILMLEDYLHVCPEDREYLQQCARDGRIKIGPMYCLSDVYCTGGEALIRNIQIGKLWCEQFGGGYSRVLHMPDTFGITPAMPMIAAGLGMKAFVFMRGVAGEVPGLTDMNKLQGIVPQIPEGTRFFNWVTPDGSTIPTVRLRHGYASAAASGFYESTTGTIHFERYVEHLQKAASEWDRPAHAVVLLMAGVDHMIPWERQAESMAVASRASTYDFHFSSLEDVADDLAKDDASTWPVCQGEFHGNGAASVLGGTLSTRIYLKQRNAAIEQLLVNQVEPGAAFAQLLGEDEPAFRLINHAWKTLLTTHPHDDICGCSVDAVHRKNESDMAQAWESADAIRRRAFYRIMKCVGANRQGDARASFAAISFQASTRLAPTRLTFDFEGQVNWGDIKLPAAYRIVNEAGESVPFREISRGQSVEHPRKTVQLELHAPLRPFCVERFYLEEIPALSAIASPTAATQTAETAVAAENESLVVTLLANGSFSITDKRTGITRARLGLFSSQGDIGDSYDFSDIPTELEAVYDKLDCQLSRRVWPGGLVELTATGMLSLPARTDSISRTRSAELVSLPFTQTLLLAPGAHQVEVALSFTNTAADHRLRWNLALSGKASTATAGLKFNSIERPAGTRPDGDTAPRIFPEHPADHFIAADGLACFSEFPINTEVVGDSAGQRLAITVCRSTSYLTNPTQGATRPGVHAGPHTLVPDCRCLGRSFVQHYAIKLIDDCGESELFHDAALWRVKPLCGQVDATMHYPWRSAEADRSVEADDATRSSSEPPVAIEGKVIVSAFKPAMDGRGQIIRLFNATGKPQDATVRLGDTLALTAVMLDESPAPECEGIAGGEHHATLTIPPYGLRTVRITAR